MPLVPIMPTSGANRCMLPPRPCEQPVARPNSSANNWRGGTPLGQGVAVAAVRAEDDVVLAADVHRRRPRSPPGRRRCGRRRGSARADATGPVALRSGGSAPSIDKGTRAGLCSSRREDSVGMMQFACRQTDWHGGSISRDCRNSFRLEGQYDRDADPEEEDAATERAGLLAASLGRSSRRQELRFT